ncbi:MULTISPECIES: cupin domain-containing protein [unclassified Sphingomonas]|uniref:cupin domain-containing protein n=1 Tax=unclassified Sphingomonas TaxID=196159 RepID=UPI0006F560C9|nr:MULTISPECIES: cupin domain-containing protein [unclassified Sphingomonas]KQX25336.1 cupin [Sphingomonas sp. Root1294]KQY66329.1 cupin [Sphingomonas sp. Root50]KRB90361.1 cupin [Sphingomonas sp. Root720]
MDPAALVERLGLTPHPEGGWYRETWREPAGDGRGHATAIYFLLEAGQRSHWHRVDAAELWLFHAGTAIDLLIAPDGNGPVETIRIGADVIAGERPQGLVPAGRWQSAETRGGWALVSCIVAPGFDFAGFELAAPGWAPVS